MTAHPAAVRPAADEFNPFYAGYIAKVPDGDVRAHLRRQREATQALLAKIPEDVAGRPYAPGKWTVRETILHVADAERVFSYRALRFARGDEKPLAGFDQEWWTPRSGANARTFASILAELAAIRAATLALVDSFDEAAWLRRGVASDHPVTVRALAWIIAGHELHHLAVLRQHGVV